jgi:DNA-binding IclR family transcriptional regulator
VSGPIADDVRRFVLTSIPSVPYLEAALLLRADPATARAASDLARLLYLPEREATELLHRLHESGVVAPNPQAPDAWHYAPSPELGAAFDALALAYSQDLIAITQLIHDATQKKAHRFADAFKWRKDR